MKRLGLELSWRDTWPRLFHPNEDGVQVLEVLRVLKCDFEGFALVCRMELMGDSLTVEDLRGNGVLTHAETLAEEEEDGTLAVFLRGGWPAPLDKPKSADFQVTVEGTPEFTDPETQRLTIVGAERDLARFLEFSENRSEVLPFRLLALTSLTTESDSLLSRLTTKQRQAVLLAYALGYYDVPRRITTDRLARRLKVRKSTLIEHLRKAHNRLMGLVVSG